jgi:hypothetical protein
MLSQLHRLNWKMAMKNDKRKKEKGTGHGLLMIVKIPGWPVVSQGLKLGTRSSSVRRVGVNDHPAAFTLSHCLPVYLPAYSRCSHLEHRASVKLFVSLQFLNPKTVGRTPWTRDQTVARPLPTQDITNIK